MKVEDSFTDLKEEIPDFKFFKRGFMFFKLFINEIPKIFMTFFQLYDKLFFFINKYVNAFNNVWMIEKLMNFKFNQSSFLFHFANF